jgi:SRSO17 transposase
MIDSDLYLPEKGWDEPDRRREAGVAESVVYRSKHEIGLEQVRRAVENGVYLGWVLADEWYGEKPAFIEGLERLGRRFVLEIPKNLMGWTREPGDADTSRGEVQNLVRWSRPMLYQPWTAFHIKDTNKGAMVWEVRASPFWMKRDKQVVGPYWLVAARDRLNRDTVKYFLSNASAGIPLETILHVAFSRWPVERCLEDEKSELGLSHFECRKYTGVLRHMRITQLSHLFLARQTERLAEKNPEVTICQVHDAANALIDALPLAAEDQKQRLTKAAQLLQDRQARNEASRKSHHKTRQHQLTELGIHVETLRCCIPTPDG